MSRGSLQPMKPIDWWWCSGECCRLTARRLRVRSRVEFADLQHAWWWWWWSLRPVRAGRRSSRPAPLPLSPPRRTSVGSVWSKAGCCGQPTRWRQNPLKKKGFFFRLRTSGFISRHSSSSVMITNLRKSFSWSQARAADKTRKGSRTPRATEGFMSVETE